MMNKLSLFLIFVLTLITSACASNAQAMEGSKPFTEYETEEVLASRSNAMAEFYKKQEMLPNSLTEIDSESTLTTRRKAIIRSHLELPQTIWSGDDLYDPAVGAELESFQGRPFINKISGGYSGDDVYDPAADGLGE
jgi:hypothetical protein